MPTQDARCACNGCRHGVNRFTRLSPERVFDALEQASAAAATRADIQRRAREALDAVDATTNAADCEAALERWLTIDMERDTAPVVAYLAPVKRWAGGPPELDAWYWDYNSF